MTFSSQDRIGEIHSFLGFAMAEWPSMREQAKAELAERCQRCVVSEKFAPLQDGVCQACRESAPGTADETAAAAGKEPEALNELLRSSSGKRAGKYDALLLFSGGKDSAYLAHRLRNEFPDLRLLAATVDNSFFSSVAMANCHRILERVGGIDHMVLKPHSELYAKTFRHAFLNLNEGGCYSTVDRMDGDLTFDIGRNLAASMDIPLVLCGLSPQQVEGILGLTTFMTAKETEKRRRSESAGFDLSQLYTEQECRSYWWDGTAWPTERVPQVVFPYYAWGYDEQHISSEVVGQGLIEEGQNNPLVTNNDTIPVMLAVDCCQMGYSGFEPEFAELVRAGKTDRAVWLNLFESLEYLTRRGQFLPGCINHTLGRLNLTAADVGIPELQLEPSGNSL